MRRGTVALTVNDVTSYNLLFCTRPKRRLKGSLDLDLVFRNYRTENTNKDEKHRVVKIRIKPILCEKIVFFTGLGVDDFIICFLSLASRRWSGWRLHNEGERKNRVGMKETGIKM